MADKPKPKVAAVFTAFHHRSHAHVILENFLEPYIFNGRPVEPPVEVVSFYADQFPDSDMARDVAKQYGIPLFDSIDGALTLDGNKLAVDAALSIAEHGNYPTNEFGQREYPHKRFFDEMVVTMRRTGQFIPVFNDKHMSHLWDEAQDMYATAQALGIPLMAGTSVTLAQRRPSLELPRNCQFEDAVVIHAGPTEVYDFHALEILLAMLESREGGVGGVTRVEFLNEEALRKAIDDGRVSLDMAIEAMKAELGKRRSPLDPVEGENPVEPHGIRVTHGDGLTTTILRTASYDATRWNFACRLKGDDRTHATHFYVGPWQNRNLFKALSHAIQSHFVNRRAPYPVERTLMVSGILDASMKSRFRKEPIETPQLDFHYPSLDYTAFREMGDSWKIITENDPQPDGIDSADNWRDRLMGG